MDRLERHYQHVHHDIDVETLVGMHNVYIIAIIKIVATYDALTFCIVQGREEEMKIFMNEVERVRDNKPREHGVIIIAAVDGMGKSKLMRAMKSKAAHMGFR